VSALSLAWSPTLRLWLVRGGSWMLAAAAVAALGWTAALVWRWLRSVGRAAAASAPGGALATVAERTLDLAGRLGELADRLDRLERLSDAREQDDRHHHDGDVVEVLGALLELNDSLRGTLGRPRAGEPRLEGGAAAVRIAPAARGAANRELE
jgi:hypothetical protein